MSQSYEMASAYITILPSFKGFTEKVKKTVGGSIPTAEKEFSKMGSSLGEQVSQKLSSGLNGVVSSIGRSIKAVGSLTGSVLTSSVVSVGETFKNTMVTGANIAGGALATAIAAVGGQMAAGGLNRALNLNNAESTLSAMGFTAKELESVFASANTAVDGTAFALDEAVKSSAKFISAGIKQGDELTGILDTAVKIANISGSSFKESADLLAKNAGSEQVYWQDILQLQDRNVDVVGAMAKNAGVARSEIKKLASSGKISFKMLQQGIDSIDFDAVLFAESDARASFGNLKTSLNRIGADLWTPIIDSAAPTFNKLKEVINDFAKTPMWSAIANAIKTNFSKNIQNIQSGIEDISKVVKGLGGDDNIVKKLSKQFDNFKKIIKDIRGPLIGAGVALTSGFLSKIPLVGGLFGKIGIGVGVMGGSLVQMYKESDLMRSSIDSLKDSLKNLFKSFGGSEEGIMKKMGDSFSKIIDSITLGISKIDLSGTGSINFSKIFDGIVTGISDFITTLFENGERIGEAIGDLLSSISESFSGLDVVGKDESIGEWLGSTIADVIVYATEILENLVPIVMEVAEALGKIITSDFTKGALEGLLSIAKWFTKHKSLLYTAAGIIGTLFVANKLSGPILAMLSFFKKVPAGGIGGAGAISGIGALITGISALGPLLMSALPGIGLLVLGITAIMFTVTSIAGLMEYSGLFVIWKIVLGSIMDIVAEILHFIVEAALFIAENFIEMAGIIATIVTTLWEPVERVLTGLSDIITNILGSILEIIGNYITTVSDAISEIVSTIGENLSRVIDSVSELLKTLSEHGLNAGAGALSASIGITALAASLALLAGGKVIDSVGNFVSGGLDFASSKFFGQDKEGGITQLILLGEAMKGFKENIESLPSTINAIADGAYNAGYEIIQNLSTGMIDSLNIAHLSVIAKIQEIMSEIQAIVTETQFNLSMSGPNMAGSSSSGGNSIYNRNTNFAVSVRNDSVIKSLARSAR